MVLVTLSASRYQHIVGVSVSGKVLYIISSLSGSVEYTASSNSLALQIQSSIEVSSGALLSTPCLLTPRLM
jgi:hypothetical protein